MCNGKLVSSSDGPTKPGLNQILNSGFEENVLKDQNEIMNDDNRT